MAKIVTVCGNSGSGKTVFGTYLSVALSKKYKVCIIYTNDITPTLPTISKNDKIKSLGALLTLPKITNINILDYINMEKGFNNLFILSNNKGENYNTYQEAVAGTLIELVQVLSSMVEFVVVVTMTKPSNTDKYFIRNSHNIINLVSADQKGIAYYQSNKMEESKSILVNKSPLNAVNDVQNTLLLKQSLIVPYCKELSITYNGYLLFNGDIPSGYKKVIDTVVSEVTADED